MKESYNWDDKTVSVIPGNNSVINMTYLISLFVTAFEFVLDRFLECMVIMFKCFAGTIGIIYGMAVVGKMLGYF